MLKNVYLFPTRLKSTINYCKVPKLIKSDLDEQFVHGNGPGGSKTNKKANCVVLKHIPTGILVKCHRARDLQENRKLARELLVVRLDNFFNGENSVEAQIKAIDERKSLLKSQKKNKINALKEEWKKREGVIKKNEHDFVTSK